MGLLQALMLIVVGKLFFHLNLGNFPLSLLVLAVFALAMAALSVFIGSMFRKEDMIVGLAVLLSNIFAALGGCWWPSEIVAPGLRQAGMVSPAYWAMDALHKLRFFRGGFFDILPHLVILLGLAAVLTVVAGRYFKIRD
jgi:ABC-2 type transport system permease protein